MTHSYVLIYGRASSDPKDLRISVDHQLTRGTRFATQHWPEAEVLTFRDDDLSAAKPGVVRPGFENFRHAVRTLPKGSIVTVVVNEQSRLTRLGERSWEDIVVLLGVAGVETVYSLKEGPISVKAGSRLIGKLLAAVHQETAERIAEDVKNTHAELFREGRPSGRAPYGYLSAKDEDGRPQLVPDPDAAPWVKQIYEWALEGVAVQVIVDRLNVADVKPRAAKWKFKDGRQVTEWTAYAVRTVLKSPTVAGLRGHTDAEGKVHTVPARWEALVDMETWRRVQRMLGQPMVVTGANGDTYPVRTMPKPQPRRYLLSGGRRRGNDGRPGQSYGVLRCGKCGHPMGAQTQARRGGKRVPAYQCHPKVHPDACGGVSISPADEVEAYVIDTIQTALVKSPKLRKRLNATTDADAAKQRAESAAAKARMLDASQLLGDGTIDRDGFDVMHAAAKARYDAAEGKLAAMTTADLTLPSVQDVTERWNELTLAQQRGVVERLIESITVAPSYRGSKGFHEDRLGKPVWRV